RRVDAEGGEWNAHPELLAGFEARFASELDLEAAEADVEEHGALDAERQVTERFDFHKGVRSETDLAFDDGLGRIEIGSIGCAVVCQDGHLGESCLEYNRPRPGRPWITMEYHGEFNHPAMGTYPGTLPARVRVLILGGGI